MTCSLKSGLNISGFNEVILSLKIKGINIETKPNDFPILGADFMGRPFVPPEQKAIRGWSKKAPRNLHIHAQNSFSVSRGLKWWEETIKPNMVEIHSAQELVCQLAETYPDAKFLKVNYEVLKTMCHSLYIHVLPFFRFYRGAEERFATIKNFKDALAKHRADWCSLGPTKGLDETEIMRLVSIGELSINFPYPSENNKVENLMVRSGGSNSSYKMNIREETAVL